MVIQVLFKCIQVLKSLEAAIQAVVKMFEKIILRRNSYFLVIQTVKTTQNSFISKTKSTQKLWKSVIRES